MKKLFYLIIGATLVASCAKTVQEVTVNDEITFQVARHKSLTKATSDYKDEYASVPFGAYAWFKGENSADDTEFMINQEVSYNTTGNLWAPTGTTYYWPKTGSLDFICYSPYATPGSTDAPFPTVTENGISYPAWDVNAHPGVDVMYADKVTGQKNNSNQYYYNGVPTLFHHALAKVSFIIKPSYLSYTADTGDTTSWEIIVNDITVNNLLTTGSFDITLDAGGDWVVPDVWTPDPSSPTTDLPLDLSSLGGLPLDGSEQDLTTDLFVLPQTLDQGQEVILNVTINTYRDNNDGLGPQLVLTETDVDITALLSGGSLDSWDVNQNITYTFNITPSLATPGDDVDGDGIPDSYEPTVVYFDPAVDDWQNVDVNAGIVI